jgi:hypothetical protein
MEEKVAFYWIGKPKTARASKQEPEIVCKTAVRVVVSLNTGCRASSNVVTKGGETIT